MIITTHKQFPNYKRYEIEYEGRPLVMETGKLAELQKKWFGETYDNLPTEAITSPEQFHKLAGL